MLSGQALQLASLPLDPRTKASAHDPLVGVDSGPIFPTEQPAEEPNQFAGMGPVLEADDKEVFEETDALVRRQQLLKDNHWNMDEYYRCVVDGYPHGWLEHDTTRDVYTFGVPYGMEVRTPSPIPNKNLELVNETSEQILVDFPEVDLQPIDDSEEAKQASIAGDRFLAQDDGEEGTNEAAVYDERVKTALFTGTAYVEYWMDPVGGGYVPLQILAHPAATDPAKPLVGPDGDTTTDYILRYVTKPEGGQFTDDPTQAAPQWQPKLRGAKWGREHIYCFPEHLPADKCDQIVLVGHCTVGEARKRWKKVATMADEDINALLDWTPTNYLRLLSPYQRARWKQSDGKTKNKAGASDERIMFYYHRWLRADPDHQKGADVVMSGLDGGFVLDRKLLAVDVEVSKGQGERVKETRCRIIPVNPITPRADPTGQDPTGKCYLSLVVGATEFNGVISQLLGENIRRVVKSPYLVNTMGGIDKDVIDNARESGETIPLQQPTVDAPFLLAPAPMPQQAFQMMELSDQAINRAAFRERASAGAENAKERSGKALQIAVSQNSIGNGSMITNVNNSRARGARIKLELMMAECTTAQQVAYVGEDGANKLMDLHAMDFALIGRVAIKAGTGTGLTKDSKVQYLGNLRANQMLDPAEANDAARESFAKRLGLPENPHEQYVSRVIDAWLDGPPKPKEADPSVPPQLDAMGQPIAPPTWQQQYQQWKQAQMAVDQQQQTYDAAVQSQQPQAGPDGKPMPQVAPVALPAPPQPNLVPKPWSPFRPRPNDTEPQMSAIWTHRLSVTMSSTKYGAFMDTAPEWCDDLNMFYDTVRKAAAVAGTTPNLPMNAKPAQQGQQPQQPTEPTHAAPTPSPGA